MCNAHCHFYEMKSMQAHALNRYVQTGSYLGHLLKASAALMQKGSEVCGIKLTIMICVNLLK